MFVLSKEGTINNIVSIIELIQYLHKLTAAWNRIANISFLSVAFIFDFISKNQNKIHHQLPDHQEVESYEQSEDAATVCNKRSEGERFLFFPNKNAVAGEQRHQHLQHRNMSLYFFCNLQNCNMQKVLFMTSAANFTLYSIKVHGMRHFEVLISHSLPYSVVYQVSTE